jgi:DNA segregation ATPase FtsK/SpoIIIE, S-DNA-T family
LRNKPYRDKIQVYNLENFVKKNKKFFQKGLDPRNKKKVSFSLPSEINRWIAGVLMILAALLIALSFFGKSGVAGELFLDKTRFFIGETTFVLPFIFFLAGIVFLTARRDLNLPLKEKRMFWPVMLAIILFVCSVSGFLGAFKFPDGRFGGFVGFIFSRPLLKYFGFWATKLIFLAGLAIGFFILRHFLRAPKDEEKENDGEGEEEKSSIIKRIFAPKFKVKEISPMLVATEAKEAEKISPVLKLETKPVPQAKHFSYQHPPLDLLEADKGAPTSGDTKVNSAIIKRTLQNFGIDVEMSEINTGPTVTQYTLKPAEGIKLSKITGLSNDLSLALASHPIRIEAPIPGRSLVGVEIPNKVRAKVGLRGMMENPIFQKSPANLLLALGKDVSGNPFYTDLTKMPHLLVAGSTGTGKTIFLNSLIVNLLYQPTILNKSAGPEYLRFILIDPKRVEFPVYSSLPHLLCPVIYNANQTMNALRWLTGEMERRFVVLAKAKAREIVSFNDQAIMIEEEPLPFIVVIIDELADLMAAKGREIEASIVRLAQMARAVGIHLIVATQRPSVEVITGLIKANITSRVTFQLASQIDSRTIIDTSGAEKLLGAGDMLFLSAETTKPKRIQAAYLSEKEVRKVVEHIKEKCGEFEPKTEEEIKLMQEIEKTSADSQEQGNNFSDGQDDSLYEEAKRQVLESRKASASFLQRRLKIGYARAARLIDILEEKGIVGPGEGAKPREVYGGSSSLIVGDIPMKEQQNGQEDFDEAEEHEQGEDGEWKKV